MPPEEIMQPLTQFGVAGLMGVLWIWERLMSRKREQQLSEAHEELRHSRAQLRVLIKLVRRNTQAFERFDQTHQQLTRLLEEIKHDVTNHPA